jgi:hypothetical protein
MHQNIGSTDRILRIVAAAVLAVLALAGVVSGVTAIVIGIIAGTLAVTALARTCPLYSICRLSTRSTAQER